jgi:plastocyanin
MNKLFLSTTLALVLFAGGIKSAECQTGEAGKKTIEMTNGATYNPAELIVSQGEKITWLNKSSEIQTITVITRKENDKVLAQAPKDAEPFSSGAIKPGETFSYTFYIPGVYEFISLPNEADGMSGKIIVTE